jgi:hypothetical protein
VSASRGLFLLCMGLFSRFCVWTPAAYRRSVSARRPGHEIASASRQRRLDTTRQFRIKYGPYPTTGAGRNRPLAGSKWATHANSAPKPNNAWWRCAESGQRNPPAMICLRRRNKVQRRRQLRRPLFVDLRSFCSSSARPRRRRGSDPAEPVRMEQLSGPGWWNGNAGHDLGARTRQIQPTLSQDGNSFTVSWTEQNI